MSARGIRWTAVNTARRPGRCRALLLRDVTAILTRPARGEREREREREREGESCFVKVHTYALGIRSSARAHTHA